MSSLHLLLLLIVFLQTAELRHSQRDQRDSHPAAGAPAAGSERSLHPGTPERDGGSRTPVLRRVPRGARDGSPRRREPPAGSHSHSHSHGPPRRHEDPSGYFTTPRMERLTPAAAAPPGNHSSGRGLLNPLFPVTEGSYWAYGVMLLALVLFAAGIVGNLALMCIVWHNFYLKSAWNCILAGLALWDFLVLFFCLPVVVFHELTLKRLLGDLSCRLVPFMEVSSLGVATFSLCALSIDRFHAATRRGPLHAPAVEPCQSILSKLAVIWLGSLLLAAPELLLWQLLQERVGLPQPPAPPPGEAGEAGGSGASLMAALRARSGALVVDVCVREPSVELPEGVYALILTYQEARMWWIFGCYICLPLLFTLACDLVTRQVLAQREPQKPAVAEKAARCSSSSSSSSATSKKQQQKQQTGREQRLRTTVMALTGLYVACNLPESVCGITLAYVSAAAAALPAGAEAALGLAAHFLLWLRCAAAPLLLLCLCRSLGQAFMDCCCCCCDECLPDAASSSAASTAATSALSSPTSPSPSSLSPSSLSPSAKEEAAKVLLPIEPAVCFERPKDCSEALGTPC